jgi:hypothetical protein
MATTQHQDPATSASGRTAKNEPRGVADTVADAASTAASTVAGAANDAMTRLPDAAATTRDALVEARQTISTGSDEQLSAGTLVSVGFALGLLVGGANRLLVLLALVPAAAMGLTLLERQTGTRPKTPSATR